MTTDFYEDDEPVEKIKAIWASTDKGRTTPPDDADERHRHLPRPEDVIAQAIRITDGAHSMGAGTLGEVAVKALREAGFTLMQPCCEACDNESGWYE